MKKMRWRRENDGRRVNLEVESISKERREGEHAKDE